ncbi:hypothetical protein H257_16189 [Aphanomyces astaci]|uniref:Integrase catalytic domain-containing protein n=1 Tax=Aphanomyces astaci TaxID=112090 RepID=W4FJE7_APHAT|nr:hypothetical protein H257_16189 [Aphanomyces astaci]ETV67590.1 hypothetical protein H257_16189 [Aphanomyces astaci]|eukprot:XP_009842847.1 hypothetical protein H257_16189 [Aphanomyces astaci]
MDFMFGLPRDVSGNAGIMVCVERASKYVVAIPVKNTLSGMDAVRLFFKHVFCHFGLPRSIDSNNDPRFTAKFWSTHFDLCDTSLDMSISDQHGSDGQTERANNVFAATPSLPASTRFSPHYAIHIKHPRLSPMLDGFVSNGETLTSHLTPMQYIHDSVAAAQQRQTTQANKIAAAPTSLPSLSPMKSSFSPIRSSQKKIALEVSESEPDESDGSEDLTDVTLHLLLAEETEDAIPSTYVVASVRAVPDALRLNFVEEFGRNQMAAFKAFVMRAYTELMRLPENKETHLTEWAIRFEETMKHHEEH